MTGAAPLPMPVSDRVRVLHEGHAPALPAAEAAARVFPPALRVSPEGPGLKETPRRMARAYAEMLTPRAFDLTTCPNDEGYDELVHVGYLPQDRIVGLSMLARVEAEHLCISLRGVLRAGTSTVASTLPGALRTQPAFRAEFLSLTATPARRTAS